MLHQIYSVVCFLYVLIEIGWNFRLAVVADMIRYVAVVAGLQKSKVEKDLIGGVGRIPGGGADWRSWHGWNTGRRGDQ